MSAGMEAIYHAAFIGKMAAMANRNGEAMAGMTPEAALIYVKGLGSDADIVCGVWNDEAGVGLHIIKGTARLKEIAATGEASDLRLDAVPCIAAEQAIAAEMVLGDGA
jgi:hypothetical protein